MIISFDIAFLVDRLYATELEICVIVLECFDSLFFAI